MTAEIKTIEASFYAAMQRGDADAMADMMADNCTYFHSFGARDTKNSYLERVRNGFFIYHRVEAKQHDIIIRGDTAIVIGTMKGQITAGGTDRELNNIRTSIWIRDDHKWKLLLFQPTPWLDK
ncbi:nuclear transport factor 2 family protein [Bacillus subtilis]|uniref:nuclear transport factor 2 family protein n=1 Tax=Pseudochrobactrum asaccharolyticum TaxID=354351 RepID=UPI001F3C935C|nr:nuclear transport factor 2 family protein [Pseudochrobactrum asaccharolyticum]MCF7646576.1 nuclear transport factor 2 family protein [Pseudochrobactrum asaccharolyticum]MCF7672715.1 nuclear transport factor 2 family protein [Bacillus subtilis]